VSTDSASTGGHHDWPGELTRAQRQAAHSEVTAIISRHAAADGSVPAAEVPALSRDLADLIDQIAWEAWETGDREGFGEGALGEDL
jgi:hypothetical protein